MVSLRIVVCTALFAVTTATQVSQCPGGREIQNIEENIQFSPCRKLPCIFRKGNQINVTMEFTADTDANDITNSVFGEIIPGLPLPFVGVHGTSICDRLEKVDKTKAKCPVKAGQTYVYRDVVPILDIYPAVPVKVHWALQPAGQKDDKYFTCFEVPIKIA